MDKSNNSTKSIYIYTNDDVVKYYGFNPDNIFKKQGIELNDSVGDINSCIRVRHEHYLITRMNIGYLNIDYSNADKVTMHNLIRYTVDVLKEALCFD